MPTRTKAGLLTRGDIKSRVQHVKRMLKAVETLLEGKLLQDAQQYSIEGRSLTRYSIPELMELRTQYRREAQQLHLLNLQAHGYNPNVIRTAF